MKRSSGILIILLLLAALLVLFLSVQQLGSFGFGGNARDAAAENADVVQQAQDAVDAVNQRLEEAGVQP